MHDPFSQVLATLGATSVRGTSLDASGDWALSFDGRGRLKFVAVMRGVCVLLLPDHAPQPLHQGDVILLSDTTYTVASDTAAAPRDGMPLYDGPGRDNVRIGDGGDTILVGGGSGFADGAGGFVLEALPRFLRIAPGSPGAGAIARTLSLLHDETGADRVGGALVAARLAEILVVEAVRAYVETGPAPQTGWITALADARIARAIRLLHDDIARRWTVAALARETGMSRSALTQRFTSKVGRGPMDYLTRWRMLVAQRRLSAGEAVGTVATAVGYTSQSAFAHAFKRVTGHAPRGGW